MGRRRSRDRRARGRSPGLLTRRRLLLVGLGGFALGGGVISSGAYSAVRPYRSGEIGATDDPDALLGMSGVTDPGQKPVFTNKSTSTMHVTLTSGDDIEFDLGDTGTWTTSASFTLEPGESQLMNVRGSDNPATVDVSVTLGPLSDPVGTINAVREFAISQAGQLLEVAGTFKTAGKSGRYEFDLENIGDNDATLVAIGVNATTNPNAVEVGKGKILTVDNTEIMSTPIPVDSSDPTTATRVDFDTNASLLAGQTRTFLFDRFLDATEKNADMTDQDIRVTVYSSDGGSSTTNICFGSCDPPLS